MYRHVVFRDAWVLDNGASPLGTPNVFVPWRLFSPTSGSALSHLYGLVTSGAAVLDARRIYARTSATPIAFTAGARGVPLSPVPTSGTPVVSSRPARAATPARAVEQVGDTVVGDARYTSFVNSLSAEPAPRSLRDEVLNTMPARLRSTPLAASIAADMAARLVTFTDPDPLSAPDPYFVNMTLRPGATPRPVTFRMGGGPKADRARELIHDLVAKGVFTPVDPRTPAYGFATAVPKGNSGKWRLVFNPASINADTERFSTLLAT